MDFEVSGFYVCEEGVWNCAESGRYSFQLAEGPVVVAREVWLEPLVATVLRSS